VAARGRDLDVGDGGAGRGDGCADRFVRRLQLLVDAEDVGQQLDGRVIAGRFDRVVDRIDLAEEPADVIASAARSGWGQVREVRRSAMGQFEGVT
jgi:hypothetical protein